MKTTVEPLEGNKVKLSVEVDEAEFEKAINAAFRKLAGEVRIPGFRPGKAPRKVLEARLGAEVGRSQALHDALPDYYVQAIKDHDVDVIAAPEFEIKEGEESGPVAFEAVVEVRPIVDVPGYGSLRVTIESPEPTDDEIEEGLQRLRNQFGELEVSDRPAIDGDYVTIDITGSQNGEPVDQLSADYYLYEVGSGRILPAVDEHLRGAKAGDILAFDAEHPDVDEDDIFFKVLVKEVKQRVLPDVDDEFANEASEFETLDELKADLRRRLSDVKKAQAQSALREKTGEALAALVETDVPEALVSAEMQQRLRDLQMRLQAQGLTLDQYVAITGKSADDFVAGLKESAEVAVKVDLALRAVGEAERVECSDDDLEQEFAELAERLSLKLAEVRKQFERADQVPAVRSDIKKRKAFDWLLERVEIVDPDGNPIDRESLVIDTEELTVDADDLDNEYQRIALQVNQKLNQVRKAYESNDLVRNLEAQIRKGKALDWLLEHVEVVDEHGTPLDRAMLLDRGDDGHDHDDHDHDHDGHDHDHHHDHDHAGHDHEH